MKAYCVRTAMGLVPSTDYDAELMNKIPLGKEVGAEVRLQRNPKFHRKFMALVGLAADNLPEHIMKEKHIYNIETMLVAIKLDLGMFDVVEVAGQQIAKLHSISFAKMDEAEFEKFYDLAVTDILNNYLVGTDREELLEEVNQFISQRR